MLKNGGPVNQNIKGYDAGNSSGPHCFVVNLAQTTTAYIQI